MPSFRDSFLARIASGTLPGVVLLAADKSGKFKYSKSLGVRSTKSESKDKPLDADTVLSIASCTKLFTAIAALQCVERGLFALDDDVAGLLPELANLDIIEGFDEEAEKLLMRPKTRAITLRALLSHCSGFGYELAQPLLLKWRAQRGEIPWSGKTIPERCTFPLLFEPSSSWMYGSGTDWAGKMIERATASTLEAYMSQHIWKPLGLTSTTFWPGTRPDLAARMADTSMLSPDGTAIPLAGFDMVNGLEDCLGGGGLYASANDLMTLLQAVLHQDPRLLKKESWDQLCADQLSEASRAALESLLRDDPQASLDCGMNVPREGRKSWSLGGLLSLDEYEDWMGKNTMLWGGMTSMEWFVDRERGLCGLAAAQVMTFGKPEIHELFGMYSRQIYEQFAEAKKAAGKV